MVVGLKVGTDDSVGTIVGNAVGYDVGKPVGSDVGKLVGKKAVGFAETVGENDGKPVTTWISSNARSPV